MCLRHGMLTSLAGLGNAFAIDCSFGRDEKDSVSSLRLGDQIEGN